ncbi:MAG TPA: hypothetical protein VG897_18155 [Terriglobales bacterium]|nr:hypothetical protein [Terriglobales bacterium]
MWFSRFDAAWTPSVIVLDPNGKERWRNEGYLPKDEFTAKLMLGLARVPFMHKKWPDAERWYNEVLKRFPQTAAAPEALYWTTVAQYKRTNDHNVLGELPARMQREYPESIWAKSVIPWAH